MDKMFFAYSNRQSTYHIQVDKFIFTFDFYVQFIETNKENYMLLFIGECKKIVINNGMSQD